MPDTPAPPSLFALFKAFLSVGVVGFGSLLPWVRRMAVQQRRWLTAGEFAALFAPAQAAPGPNMLVVTLIGWRVVALPGAMGVLE